MPRTDHRIRVDKDVDLRPTVSQMATLARAGLTTNQLDAASAALASVNDQIAAATKTFATAAQLAQEGQGALTFPFIAGKAASALALVKTLQKTMTDSSATVRSANGVGDLLTAFNNAAQSLEALRAQASQLAG